VSNPNGSRLRHGHGRTNAKTPEYKVWMAMRSRCNSPNNHAFSDYGGRGIKVCERWNTFENFLADMGARPQGMTLDRKNNDRGYEPGNCRWATMKSQQRNRRNNRLFTVGGLTATMAEHCERSGVKPTTAYMRLAKGASIEAALSKSRAPYRSLPGRGKALNVTIERLANG